VASNREAGARFSFRHGLEIMQSILVSACLLGEAVRYNGGDPPAEITRSGGGRAVLDGEARVLAVDGRDVTKQFLRGAERALAHAQAMGIRVAVLKEGSPSCGTGAIYDGSFSGTKVTGVGVTAACLAQAGVRVFSEHQLADAARLLEQLERAPGEKAEP
jgi:uncharacterized protein YbbK (DUF523 family)